jgi:hypothetical protein
VCRKYGDWSGSDLEKEEVGDKTVQESSIVSSVEIAPLLIDNAKKGEANGQVPHPLFHPVCPQIECDHFADAPLRIIRRILRYTEI